MATKTESRRFHAFVSYSEKDQGFVDKMADTLESKPYKMTCVRPDRDFLPGLPVTSNIDQHLEASRKILFVLSDHSVKSPWCRFQIQGILRDRGEDVAVVVVGGITVPDYLNHVYTIQATSSMSGVWMTKLTRFLGYIACFPCQREGRETKAIVYCNNCRHGLCDPCQQQHRRQPDTHQHRTRDVTDVDVSPLTVHTDCPDHHKPLELFCRDCNVAICYICSVVSHKQCSVSTLTDSVSVLKQSLSIIKDKLSQNIDFALKDRASIADMEKKISQTKEQHQYRIKKEFSEMKTVLDKREKESLQQIQTITQSNVTKIHENIKVTENEIRTLREKCDEISTALKSQSENTVYETFSEYRNVKTDYNLTGLTKDLILKEIRVDTDFDRFRCDLNDHEVKCSELVYENRRTGTPILHSTVSLGDVGVIWDMCVVTQSQSDFIIMASHNEAVHCFDVDKSKVISSLSVQSDPLSVTKLSDHRVAVSLLFPRHLLLVDVTPHLSLHSTHKTRGGYFGMTTLTPSTLVASGSPRSLDILDLTGRVLRSVCTDHQRTTLFSYPFSVCINRTGNILVADYRKNSVVCVSDTGEEVFSYQPTGDKKLNNPIRVKTNKDGDVFVTDNNKLVQLTSTGLYIRDVIRKGEEGVKWIHSMCFDSQGNMRVVLSDQTDKIVMSTYRFV